MVRVSASRLALIGIAAAVALALGTWVYSGVQRELRTLAAANLRSLLDTQVGALDTWIREKQLNVERWAKDARVIEAASVGKQRATPAAAADGATALEACRGAVSDALISAVDALRQSDAAEGVNLVDRSGRVLATRTREYCGLMITAERLKQLNPVFDGRSMFAPPMSERERLDGADKADARRRPLVWFSAPVRNAAGETIAALSIGKFADARFSSSLVAVRPGSTGEAYAFDARGRMLSESRFRAQLEQRGTLKPGDSTILSVRLNGPEQEEATQPLTALAAVALDRVARANGEFSGEVLQPYTNYVGMPVIGAWRWLPQYGFGIAIEVGRDEVFAPLRRVETAYRMVAALAALVLLALLAATLWIQVLRRQRDEARQLGNYELLEQIAEGGMASVWRARHRLLKRPVAIKLLSLRVSNDEGLARFEREVRSASQLMHPNTVAIFDYGRSPAGELYCAMELLDGMTVQQLVERHQAQPVGRVAYVMHGIASSLFEAHERGLVHRDIKPGNVMLCRVGIQSRAEFDIVKVLDFGLVKSISEPHTRDLTRALRILGTPSYMAPERIQDPGSADLRSDIYSLGALGYFMLTGRPPYQAENDLALAYQVVNAPVPELDAVNSLTALIGSCLQKEAAARPQNTQQVIDRLDEIMREFSWTAADARTWWGEHANSEGSPTTSGTMVRQT
ncbi:MAG: serine/threonine protein kinase [Pseudomonadota bacterium]|nr:serine/threonine protein kinase [Pseudomonadota bacterium]